MVASEAQNGDELGNSDVELAISIAKDLIDPKHPMNIECLLDSIIALHYDCNLPALKRIRSVEMFLEKFGPLVKTLIDSRMKTSDFRMIKVIGRGAYGEVQLVRHNRTQKVFAMKRLEKAEMIRRYDVSFFSEERNIMAHSNSDWIVKMFYSFQDHRHLYMVMEFMPGGDLVNLMSHEEISEEMARFYIAELVLALDAIHGLGYIHRDVKPDNMLLSSSGHLKLADFGTCVKLNPEGKIKCATAAGTPDYISPEVLNSQCSESVYGIEVDYWSVGIILYEMLYGDPPFYADTLIKTYSRIQNFSTELKFPSDVTMSNEVKDIIRKFLSAANVRLGRNGISEIREHSFFKNDTWNFDNIRYATPPFVPNLTTDDDTSNFEDVDQPDHQATVDNFQMQQAFNGSQLPFIGFTYSNDLNPASALSLLSDVTVVQEPAIQIQQETIEIDIQERPSNGTVVNGGGEPALNGISEQVKIDIVKEQILLTQNMQSLIDDKEEEIRALKEQVSRSESCIQKLQRDKTLIELRFNTLDEEKSTAQSLINVYKAELDEFRSKYYENDRQLNNYDGVLESLREIENKLRSEQIARRLADQNVGDLEKEKSILKAELNDLVNRRSEDLKIINTLRQRETELLDALNKANNESFKAPSHGSRPNTGPVIHHRSERSNETNLSSNVSASRSSIKGLEAMSYDELLAECRRQITLKQNAIEKLFTIGRDKGIEAESAASRTKSTKKQRADIQRARELWDRDHAKEKQRLLQSEREKEDQLQYHRNQLQDAMLEINRLVNSERELQRQLAEYQNIHGAQLPKGLLDGIATGLIQPKKKRINR